MPLKIVRNDITKMNTEAIVNTAGETPEVGDGCDVAVYMAAGYDILHALREEIGDVEPGEVFITPGFNLPAKYIIHAVSPLYIDGKSGEEKKLRSCYRKSLELARKNEIRSIAFPLISTGAYGYPKEEGMRIAIDEINAFLLNNEIDVTLVVFDSKAVKLGLNVYPDLEAFIDQNYVEEKREEEYGDRYFGSVPLSAAYYRRHAEERERVDREIESRRERAKRSSHHEAVRRAPLPIWNRDEAQDSLADEVCMAAAMADTSLDERMEHAADPFGKYLLYLIKEKGMSNAEVYKRALISKQSFGKLNKDPDRYHPDKVTALQYCVGARLNLDETKDMLARAGYALSPADKRDIIFEYFISHEVFDMIDIDIALEEHDIPCIIK
jgi:O-acetyl-ADP-ribose deacetylase (regulator of RNase III)